jgi:hypothetical protein
MNSTLKEWAEQVPPECATCVSNWCRKQGYPPAQAVEVAKEAVDLALHAALLIADPKFKSVKHLRNWVVRKAIKHVRDVLRDVVRQPQQTPTDPITKSDAARPAELPPPAVEELVLRVADDYGMMGLDLIARDLALDREVAVYKVVNMSAKDEADESVRRLYLRLGLSSTDPSSPPKINWGEFERLLFASGEEGQGDEGENLVNH